MSLEPTRPSSYRMSDRPWIHPPALDKRIDGGQLEHLGRPQVRPEGLRSVANVQRLTDLEFADDIRAGQQAEQPTVFDDRQLFEVIARK